MNEKSIIKNKLQLILEAYENLFLSPNLQLNNK